MNLFLFTNSTGCMTYEEGIFKPDCSYVDALLQSYDPEGLWINGVTILHVRKIFLSLLKGTDRKVILHLGACEAFSHPPINFLHMGCINLLRQDMHASLFQRYVVPKMFKATECLLNKSEEYIRLLEPEEFALILDEVLWMMQGSKVLVIGMSQPKTVERDYWKEQAREYNEVFKNSCLKYNAEFLDIWDSHKECIDDSTHLNVLGHSRLFNQVVSFIERGKI